MFLNQMLQPFSLSIMLSFFWLVITMLILQNIRIMNVLAYLFRQDNFPTAKTLIKRFSNSMSNSNRVSSESRQHRKKVKIYISHSFIIEINKSLCYLCQHFIMIFLSVSQFLLILHTKLSTLSNRSCSSFDTFVSDCFSTFFLNKDTFCL